MAALRKPDSIQDSDRITAFSDGVVAIAITVLALPLFDIDLPDSSSAQAAPLTYVWLNNYALIISFVISWGVIIKFWLVHHRIFGGVDKVNNRVLSLNILWLFAVVILPLPMNLLAQDEFGANATQIVASYIGVLVVMSGTLTLISREVRQHPELQASDHDWNNLENQYRGYLTTLVIACMFLVSFFVAEYALWGLTVLFFTDPAAKYLAERKQQRTS